MIDTPQSRHRNLLLRRMDPAGYAALAPSLEPFRAELKYVFCRPDKPISHAIFLEDAVGSLVLGSSTGNRAEAGLFGFEGFGIAVLVIGEDRSSYEGTIQVPGNGFRVPLPALREALERSPALNIMMQRFAHVMAMQAAFTALSNAVHSIERRLARWLLMCDDRVASGELALTHEFMAIMLAVRRPSVTTALHVLEGHGFVAAERGRVIIRNRAALEGFAGDAYGQAEREYERLLGPLR